MLNLFRSVSADYEADKIKNQDKTLDLSCLVEQVLEISNLRFLEGLQENKAFWGQSDELG